MVNLHELGKNFVEEVIVMSDKKVSPETGAFTAGHLAFECRIRGWQEDTRAQVKTSLLQLGNIGLRQHLAHSGRSTMFRIPTEMWPGFWPRDEPGGW